jgi:hypothetical protein
MSSIDYYENPDKHGNYQYTTLDQLVNDYLMSRDSDDYTSTLPRYKIVYQAKRGLRELYYDVLREIRAIELDLSPTLTIVVPPDFVNLVRISWVDEYGQLHPMAIDTSLSMAQVYLQDNNYELLFDDSGCVLRSNDLLPNAEIKISTNNSSCRSFNFFNSGFQPNKDFSKVYTNGKFNFDKSTGVIQFSSDVEGKSVVIEYISDGLYTGCEGRPEGEIRVHKFAETTLLDFIYYNSIKNRKNVPFNEKQRARKEFYNSMRITKRRINTLGKADLLQTFKGANRWFES